MGMNAKHSRLGQSSGSDAWILVGLVGLIMLFYIMFLPQEERQKLLEDQPTVMGPATLQPAGPILQRTPGRLDALQQSGFEHAIPSFRVVEVKNAQVLASLNPFSVSNSWLGEYPFVARFELDHPELVDAPLLVFEAPVRRGLLQIRLNDKQVGPFELQTADAPPIMLKRQDMQKENVIEFSVSGVGPRFWSRNRYDIVNARVIGDVSDVSRQKAQNVFTLSPQEKANLESARLSFVPECDQVRIGLLEVSINGRSVYAGIPACNSPFQSEMETASLQEGTNEVVFKTERGTINVNMAKVTTKVRQTGTFIDYFEIPQALFNEVVAGRRRVELQIDFVDDGKPKRATVNVNGHLTFIDQREPFYARPLNPWILPGPRNYVELRPETTLQVAELRVMVR